MKRFILGLSMFLAGLLGNAMMLSGVATYTGNIVTEGAKWVVRLEAVGLMAGSACLKFAGFWAQLS